MCDILCTADDNASTLSHHTTVFMMSHPLQAWHHTPVSDIAPTVSLSSQAPHWYHTHFWMTSHPATLWHHMHYIDNCIQSLCYHTTVLITTSIYVTTSSMYGNIYTIHETSQPLSVSAHPLYRQHHTHSLYDITLAMGVASFALYKTWHPHFMTSDNRVFLITPRILGSFPLYLCHHLHCTDDITPTVSLRSHPL